MSETWFKALACVLAGGLLAVGGFSNGVLAPALFNGGCFVLGGLAVLLVMDGGPASRHEAEAKVEAWLNDEWSKPGHYAYEVHRRELDDSDGRHVTTHNGVRYSLVQIGPHGHPLAAGSVLERVLESHIPPTELGGAMSDEEFGCSKAARKRRSLNRAVMLVEQYPRTQEFVPAGTDLDHGWCEGRR